VARRAREDEEHGDCDADRDQPAAVHPRECRTVRA
jgi:hypothetical protein